MQLHGIGSNKLELVYKEVFKVRSNYKKSYLCWLGNPARDDSTGSNQTEKDKVVYLLDLFEGRRKKEQCDFVCDFGWLG